MFVARDAPFLYRAAQCFLWVVCRVFTRLHASGFENVPRSGPVIVSPSHLHSFDIPLTAMVVRRYITVMAGEKWKGKPGGLTMELFTKVIYVMRGEVDRVALAQALEELKAGGTLAVAPEGTRSRTGGLQEGKDGAAYLASRSGAVIVPVVIWGHEKAVRSLLRLRRADVHVRVCSPVVLPAGSERARTAQLREITEQLMLAIAGEMPPEYRGVYADRF